MRTAKPLLLVSTPIGVGWGLLEAWHIAWWLGALMLTLLTVVGAFFALTVRRIHQDLKIDH
jgi:hypothetical protein